MPHLVSGAQPAAADDHRSFLLRCKRLGRRGMHQGQGASTRSVAASECQGQGDCAWIYFVHRLPSACWELLGCLNFLHWLSWAVGANIWVWGVGCK